MQRSARDAVGKGVVEPWDIEFGLQTEGDMKFPRNEFTRLFDDQKMVTQLVRALEDPISNLGAQNVPRYVKAVEILGILQGRKWEVGTLNDFRDFFSMPRHETLEASRRIQASRTRRETCTITQIRSSFTRAFSAKAAPN